MLMGGARARSCKLNWSLLAAGHGDPVPCGVTKRFARLSDNYTVYFTTCYDPKAAPGCQCPDSQNITDAWFWRDERRNLKHNSSSFWVTSSELHIHHGGRYWFRFEYSYHCHLPTRCKQGGIRLELRVAKFSLRFLNASKYHARGSNVWLLCSSHLNDSRTVEVRFHFRSHDNRTLHASCPANQSKTISHHNGHWLVHRDHETHDCILEIRNVNKDTDAGEYQCNGSLPVNGRIEYDMSNQENLIVYNDSSPSSAKPFEDGSIIGIAIATGFVVLLLLVASVRVCVMICRRPPHPPPPPPPNPPPPHPNPPAANPPPPHHAPLPEGRGNGVAAVLLVDPPSASCGSGDEAEPLLQRRDPPVGRSSQARASPKKPKNNYEALDTTAAACDGARKKSQQWTGHSLPALTIEGPSMKQDHLTGKTSSKEISPPISPSQDPTHLSFTLNEESSNKDSSSESTDSSKENRHGSFTTEAAVEYVQSQNEPPSHTPESEAPFDDNLQCQKCGRKYKEGQIQHFKKHMETCQGN